MKYALAFAALAAGLGALVLSAASPPGRALLTAGAVAATGLAAAYALRKPQLLGKRPDGRMSALAWLVFWPYLAVSFLSLWVYRRVSREDPISEIAPGLYLGCRLFLSDRAAFEERAIGATLDLTAELSEVRYARGGAYLNIPLLDTLPPTRDQLAHAAEWISRHLSRGGVLVHCALGHGRSAGVVAAHLLSAGRATSAPEALALLKERRPGVDLAAGQARALADYASSL